MMSTITPTFAATNGNQISAPSSNSVASDFVQHVREQQTSSNQNEHDLIGGTTEDFRDIENPELLRTNKMKPSDRDHAIKQFSPLMLKITAYYDATYFNLLNEQQKAQVLLWDEQTANKAFEKLSSQELKTLDELVPQAVQNYWYHTNPAKYVSNNQLIRKNRKKTKVSSIVRIMDTNVTPFQHDDFQNESPPCCFMKFMQLLGRLRFIVKTRPDIAYAVNRLATRSQIAAEKDFKALLRIVSYLYGTNDI